MELISEIFIELLFRRIIVRFFGYYTLFFFYKLTNQENALKWLNEASRDESEEFGKGCLISVIGLISFSLLIFILAYIFF
jgi:hypothetical protein